MKRGLYFDIAWLTEPDCINWDYFDVIPTSKQDWLRPTHDHPPSARETPTSIIEKRQSKGGRPRSPRCQACEKRAGTIPIPSNDNTSFVFVCKACHELISKFLEK